MKNYQESQEILNKIKNAKKILLALHVSPDADSVGSNLAMFSALQTLGKEVEIISTDQLPASFSFLDGVGNIIYKDIADINLSHDLFISLDSSSLRMISKKEEFFLPKSLFTIVIDHHETNQKYGNIHLVDAKAPATAIIIYALLHGWNTKIDKNIATDLLTGVIGDTAGFKYNTDGETLQVAAELAKSGAILPTINFNLFQRLSLASARLWGLILSQLEKREVVDISFVWTGIPISTLDSAGEGADASGVTTVFFSSIDNTDFGVLFLEEEPGEVKASLRSRTDIVNVAGIAKVFGGGGHKKAAGFKVKVEDSFEKTVNNLLGKIEEYLEKQ